MASFLDQAAPNWLSVCVLATVPLAGFGIPWLLARRDPAPSGPRRRGTMLVAAVPLLFTWIIVSSILAPADHVAPIPDTGPDPAVQGRHPRSVGELLARAGVGMAGFGVLIWSAGAIAARTGSSRETA